MTFWSARDLSPLFAGKPRALWLRPLAGGHAPRDPKAATSRAHSKTQSSLRRKIRTRPSVAPHSTFPFPSSTLTLAMHKKMWIPLVITGIGLLVLIIGFGTQRLYLCRISFLALALLLFFPFLARSGTGSRLLLGAFDLAGFWEAAAVGFLLFLTLWAIRMTSESVLSLGAVRIGHVLPGRSAIGQIVRDIASVLIVVAHLVCLLLVSGAPWFQIAGGFVLGLVSGIVLYLFSRLVLLPFVPGSTERGHEALQKLADAPLIRVPVANFFLPKQFWRGYFTFQEGKLRIYRPHVEAFLSLVILFVFYLGVRRAPLPPLGYLLLLAAIYVWLFAGVAFFFDAYRVPVLLPLIIWVALFAHSPNSDHYYPLTTAQKSAEPDHTSPGELLDTAESDDRPFVLVAAAGGGIQAAAWTTQVLTGLDNVLGDPEKQTFARSIRVVSGVSGGSVGLMDYLQGEFPLSGQSASLAQNIIDSAEASSLGPAVQGLAYSDLMRILAPFLIQDREEDRARGLERAWVSSCDSRFPKSGKPLLAAATLKEWRQETTAGQLPAVIFNATVVETGQRFTFSTSHFGNQDIAQGQADFDALYGDWDVAISTAARLSATFPFVSPAARPDLANSVANGDLHLVDGGYFDNSGLVALTTWLDAALQSRAAKGAGQRSKEILVIQILPFPIAESGTVRPESGPFFQLLSPLQAVLNVRNQVQTGFSQRDFSAFSKRWELDPVYPVRITFATVSFPQMAAGYQAPLSWHLRGSDKAEIKAAWDDVVRNNELAEIRKFFARNAVGP